VFARLRLFAGRIRRPAVCAAAATAIAATLMVGSAPASPKPATRVAALQPTPAPVPAFIPSRILIPALRVDAPIVPVGTESDGAMGTPKTAADVAWWQGMPVGKGNALFAAHHDWNGDSGAFYSLGDLRPGAQVTVKGQGQSLTFIVTWVQLLKGNIDATGILGSQGGTPVVTLITCGGVFDTSIRHHLDRYVVRGVLPA
jgi:LPXTG-site transpeptidase (sortase) family protein